VNHNDSVAAAPDATYGFEAQGKHWEMRIFFQSDGMAYEIHQGGKKLGERQWAPAGEAPKELVERFMRIKGVL